MRARASGFLSPDPGSVLGTEVKAMTLGIVPTTRTRSRAIWPNTTTSGPDPFLLVPFLLAPVGLVLLPLIAS